MDVVMKLVIILGSIALHEFAHAKSADAAGDPTPRSQGRVTLNPLAHLDQMGTIMIFVTVLSGFGFGWGKPVMVNPRLMRNPKWDHFLSVLWGPLTNLLLAIFFAVVLRLAVSGTDSLLLAQFCLLAVVINLFLCLFNLIPLGPLDGHWLLAALLPERIGLRFGIWSRQYGTMVLFGIILLDQLVLRKQGLGILTSLIGPPFTALLNLLVGPDLAGRLIGRP